MIFPKSEPRHHHLLTAYTDFHALLSSLKSESFSGIIEIEFPEKRGILFIDSGEIINAEAQKGDDANRVIGTEAIRYLLALMNQKDGIFNIYSLSPERVAILASHLHHEILFKGLSTDFTRLDRLLLKLKEEKHNGFIEVLSKENQATGVLFFEGGEPIEMFTTQESGLSIYGRKSIQAFVENAIKEGSILNVYKSHGKIFKEEKAVPREKGGQKELILTLQILQEILSTVEKRVDRISRKGKFIETFKKTLIQKSKEYPFLDPFGGEFDYREGTILFDSQVREKDFVKGIIECLRAALFQIEGEIPPKKMNPAKLRLEIKSSLEHHRETMKRLGIEAIVSSLFQ